MHPVDDGKRNGAGGTGGTGDNGDNGDNGGDGAGNGSSKKTTSLGGADLTLPLRPPTRRVASVEQEQAAKPPPDVILDLAAGCVRHVERALGVKLDYEPETLSLLDHYIEQSRSVVREQPDMLSIVAQTSGAYLGEVVRRRYASWWRVEGGDPATWQIELESVYLAFSPVQLILDALLRSSQEPSQASPEDSADLANEREGEDEDQDEGTGEISRLELEEEDRVAVAARLAELPPVSEEEFYAPSTRLEVIDIAIEAIRARRIAGGEQVDAMLRPEDYEHG